MNTKTNMLKTYLLICLITTAIASCKKSNDKSSVPAGAVYIAEASVTDTIVHRVPSTGDTAITVKFVAGLYGPVSAGTHTVVFTIDTTQITGYQAQYGSGTVMPAAFYQFVTSTCQITAGATQSDSAEITVPHTSPFTPGVTYVLPVVILSVDGGMDGVEPGQVLYLVYEATSNSPISTANWTIVSSSGSDGIDLPQNLLDNNPATFWATSFGTPMPQDVVIDMGQPYLLYAVTYTNSPDAVSGIGQPTKVEVELSTDGVTWVNNGTFAGSTATAPITLPVSPGTARYIRFTVLTSSGIFGTPYMEVGDIGAIQTE